MQSTTIEPVIIYLDFVEVILETERNCVTVEH